MLNPVRAGFVAHSVEWPWSSYLATIGDADKAPEWLDTRSILSAFGETECDAVAAYIGFVSDGIQQSAPWKRVQQQMMLGSDGFVDALLPKIPAGSDLREVPQARPRPTPRPLADFAGDIADQDHAIAAAHASGGYTLKQIGEHFGLHYSRVSRIIRRAEEAPSEARVKT
ncbi:hypothetical protein [Accumulibacter sp.]|uniref:hypothetical protein n=1 Tax=Accumulibacter sp. TaxID=2053492 RepID=UPI003458D681